MWLRTDEFVQHNPDVQKPWDPKLIWKEHNYNLFEAELMTVAAKIKVLVQTSVF